MDIARGVRVRKPRRLRAQFTGEWQLSQLDDVIAQFNRAIQLDPNMPNAHQGLSRAMTIKGDVDEALRLIRRALEPGRSDADNLLFLGTVLYQKGDVSEATRAEEQALELNPLRPSYYSRHYAEILWAAGQYDRALEQSEECLQKAPGFTRCEIFRVLVLMRQGRESEASSRDQSAVARFANFDKSVQAVIPKPPELAAHYQRDIRAADWSGPGDAASRRAEAAATP